MNLLFESFRFAWSALMTNLLRTMLSLLGVTIGIFVIISVFTLVDSLERNIKQSFDFLGSNIIYVAKWPFTPDSDGEFRWWDFWNRPTPSYAEYKLMEESLQNGAGIVILSTAEGLTARRGNNSLGDVKLSGVSSGYPDVFELNIAQGRYFSVREINAGRHVVIIGDDLVQGLFQPGEDPIGKEIRLKKQPYRVVGVLPREGESFIGFDSKDNYAFIPYDAYRTLYSTGTGRWNEKGSSIVIKGQEEDIGLAALEGEVTGMLRTRRGLKPKEENNFAINRPEAITNMISGVFDIIGLAGWVIGGFSILIGGFGIANIMFVSVKERTNIIGIQKSLGAKNNFILMQFLFEAIFLSLIGGLAGLILVLLFTFIPLGDMEVQLSIGNVLLSLIVSAVIGIVSGIVPAAMASKLDPVVAIRS